MALAGLLVTFSGDDMLNWWGWQIFRLGFLGVFVLMAFMTANLAVWSMREGKGFAGSLVFAFFVILMFAVIALFLDLPQLRDALFYAAIPLALLAPLVQALHDRRQRKSSSDRR